MREKRRLLQGKETEPDFSSSLPPPQLSRHPETGKLVLGSAPALYASDDDNGSGKSELSSEERRRRDEEFKRKFREAQPGVGELAGMMGSRMVWLMGKSWTEYMEKPWFWHKWGKGRGNWQTQSSKSDQDRGV